MVGVEWVAVVDDRTDDRVRGSAKTRMGEGAMVKGGGAGGVMSGQREKRCRVDRGKTSDTTVQGSMQNPISDVVNLISYGMS